MKNIAIFLKIKELYLKNKKMFFASVILVVLILIVLFYPFNKSQNDDNNSQILVEDSGLNSYSKTLETKIKNMLLKLSSIDRVDVMVILNSSVVNNFLTQKESTKTSNSAGDSIVEKEEIVFEKNGSTQKPVLISVSYPKVLSVMVVINNVDASTKLSIKNALSGVLNIDSSCIFILQDR